MQGRKHYQEKLFTTFQLSSHMPQDNFYLRLSTAPDLHWLYAATQHYYGTEGQASIDPVVFFRLIVVGYLKNLDIMVFRLPGVTEDHTNAINQVFYRLSKIRSRK